jgi:exopolysaccharide biosynthesis protein
MKAPVLSSKMIHLFFALSFCFCSFFLGGPLLAQDETRATDRMSQPARSFPNWKSISEGIEYAKMAITGYNSFLKSEMYLIKINLNHVQVTGAHAPTHLGKNRTSVRSMVKAKSGIAGINANFFDQKGHPLGVLIIDTENISSLHKGGKLLTGIFQIKNDQPSIIPRDQFSPEMVRFAVQSGPRLLSNKERIKVSSQDQRSRRSGIALTEQGELILFATLLRFPGATLHEIQSALLSSGLTITDALNLDGGGSSQLFFYEEESYKKEISITGGDDVPAALIVVKKDNS